MDDFMDAQRIETLSKLPKRADDGHKGTFGSVAIIGGAAGKHLGDEFAATMLGAPALAAMGAIRAGCGLVRMAVPMPIVEAVLTLAPFATGFGLEVDSERAIVASSAAVVIDELVRSNDVIVVGPGMGSGHEVEQVVVRLIGQEDVPMVVDADGLNILASDTSLLQKAPGQRILTPHPGEMSRLTGVPTSDIQKNRFEITQEFATKNNVYVVLKGVDTLVCDPKGNMAINPTGNGGMAAGGMGDVIQDVSAQQQTR